MTLYEVLQFNRELLMRLEGIGLKPDDHHYIDLFSDYERMHSCGDKVTYIVSVLAERYAVSERKVYALIKRFKTDCTLRAE